MQIIYALVFLSDFYYIFVALVDAYLLARLSKIRGKSMFKARQAHYKKRTVFIWKMHSQISLPNDI